MPAIDLTPPFICNKMTPPVIPTLPAGITFEAGLPNPSFPFAVKLCCRVLQFDPGSLIPPTALGISVSLALIVAINGFIVQVNSYMAAIPMVCPKEL